MALHTQLPIYRTGLELLSLAHRVQEQMPRGMKRTVGEKIAQHCIDILELMALANASKDQRAHYLRELLTHQRTVEVLLRAAQAQIEAKLAELHLHLNPRKTILQPVARGIDFVGQVIRPWRRTTRARTLATALERLHDMPASDVFAAGNSYLGLVRQATHSHAERAALCRALLQRGHAVEGRRLSKVFKAHAGASA